FDRDVAAFDIAHFTQAFSKRPDVVGVRFGRAGVQKSNYRHCGLLRARRERPRDGRTADKRYELAPPHLSHLGSTAVCPICHTGTWAVATIDLNCSEMRGREGHPPVLVRFSTGSRHLSLTRRLELQAHSRFGIRSGYGPPVATGAEP